MEADVVVFEFAVALGALLGTLLIPFILSYQVLRLKRRAVRITAPLGAPQVTAVSHALR